MDNETHQLLGSLHGKVDILLEERALERAEREKTNARVTTLEHDKTKVTTYAAVASLFVTCGAWVIERLWH